MHQNHVLQCHGTSSASQPPLGEAIALYRKRQFVKGTLDAGHYGHKLSTILRWISLLTLCSLHVNMSFNDLERGEPSQPPIRGDPQTGERRLFHWVSNSAADLRSNDDPADAQPDCPYRQSRLISPRTGRLEGLRRGGDSKMETFC